MIFRRLTHDDLGCASYLIVAKGAGVAGVVDPKREARSAGFASALRPLTDTPPPMQPRASVAWAVSPSALEAR